MDDLWQGKWLTAQTSHKCQDSECTYTFQPLAESENPLAKNLPGTRYRRTLKIGLVSAAGTSAISALQVCSPSGSRGHRWPEFYRLSAQLCFSR
ncbi:MAG: hypothetical protein DMG57_40180 [Acidobacteria bacterium]|nr:MAG: hypothetical protein DMG57_40180 [Acidobacteriota bacterium]